MPPNALMARLAAADLAIDATPDQDAAEALLRNVLSARAASAADDGLGADVASGGRKWPRRHFGTVVRANGPPRRRLARWAVVGMAAIAAAVSLLVVGTTGGGPSSAFAGWSATPTTTAASGQVQAAESACQSVPGLPQGSPDLASLTPTLVDTRGPFSLLIYTQNGTSTVCLAGLPHSGAAIFSAGEPYSATIDPTAIEPEWHEAAGALVVGQGPYHLLVGQTGSDVTGVTLTMDDGGTVQTTTANGWFAAWWPGSPGVRAANVTTGSGSTTQQLNVPALDMPGGPNTQPGTATTS
jgi:hypothetical protein